MTLAELIVKLKLTGAEETKTGVKGVKEEIAQTGEASKTSGEKMQRFFVGGLQKGVEVATRATAAFALLGLATGGIVGKAAASASIEFTSLNARLEAVTGSADKAARKLAYAQAVANPSNFTFKQLADATVTLEAFGINAERALPTIARLGMAFGADSEKLGVLVRGLGDLSTGKFLQSDVASSFGLNRKQFEAQGIKFDGQGQLLSSATETMAALEKIVNTKYGGIFAKMADTPGAKLASLQDSWDKALRVIGDGILKVAAPGIERLTALLNGLDKSGVALDVVKSAAEGFSKMFGGVGQGDGMLRFVSGLLSVMARLPGVMADFGKYVKNVFDVVSNNIGVVFNYVVERLKPILTIVGRILTAFGHVFADLFLTAVNDLSVDKDVGASLKKRGLKDVPALPKNVNLLSRQEEFYGRLKTAMAVPTDNSVPKASGAFLNAGEPAKQTDLLAKIDRNTGKSADLLSLRASATGPGAAGVVGATAAELQGGAPSRRIVIDTVGAENAMRRAIKEIAQELITKGVGNSMNGRAF